MITVSTPVRAPGALAQINPRVRELLRCPSCGCGIEETIASDSGCSGAACGARYPVVNGIPILIDERSSLFTHAGFLQGNPTYFAPHSSLREIAKHFLPVLGRNLRAHRNYRLFLDSILARSTRPLILVIGGSIPGEGMESLDGDPRAEFVETDVAFGPRTKLISDAHAIPFADAAFDGVIVQAVLEHVLDPYRCAAEIHRVLRPGGLVYAETPFMQQVHGGQYDFTRFTHLGHRRLFRRFDELSSGACGGPGMALAWSLQYFALSFFTSHYARAAVKVLARLSLFWLKYFDFYLAQKPGGLDAASGFYFLGQKSERALSDRDLISQYRGAAFPI